MPSYDYRRVDPLQDKWITDANTGAIQGVRNEQNMQMLNGVSDYASLAGGGLTAISDRQIGIPANAQAPIYGGITISNNASITCGGEFVAVPY